MPIEKDMTGQEVDGFGMVGKLERRIGPKHYVIRWSDGSEGVYLGGRVSRTAPPSAAGAPLPVHAPVTVDGKSWRVASIVSPGIYVLTDATFATRYWRCPGEHVAPSEPQQRMAAVGEDVELPDGRRAVFRSHTPSCRSASFGLPDGGLLTIKFDDIRRLYAAHGDANVTPGLEAAWARQDKAAAAEARARVARWSPTVVDAETARANNHLRLVSDAVRGIVKNPR